MAHENTGKEVIRSSVAEYVTCITAHGNGKPFCSFFKFHDTLHVLSDIYRIKTNHIVFVAR